eukprot:scaffold48755_cov60-Phaeocystis_antarctica.AAC.2
MGGGRGPNRISLTLCLTFVLDTFQRKRGPGKVRHGWSRRHACGTDSSDRARRPRIHEGRLLCALIAAVDLAAHHGVVRPNALT